MKHSPHQTSATDIEAAAADWVLRRERGLNEKEQRDFAHWLTADPRHGEVLAHCQQTWSILDGPRSKGAAVRMSFDLTRRARRRRQHHIGLAAALASILVVVSVFWFSRQSSPKEGISSSTWVAISTTQMLPDGSVAELKEGSELAIDFSGPQRRVRLTKGEAFFQVAKNKERPFVVRANGVDVKAVGTAFAVGLADGVVDVVVTEGRVAVQDTPLSSEISGKSSINGEMAPFLASLKAGEQLTVNPFSKTAASHARTINTAEMETRLAWRRLEFSQTPLSEAVAMMNRGSRVQMVVEDAKLGSIPVSGIFRADNTDALVRLLEENFGVAAERNGEKIILRTAQSPR